MVKLKTLRSKREEEEDVLSLYSVSLTYRPPPNMSKEKKTRSRYRVIDP